MKKFNWKSLPKPFFALAPMDDVTDTVFRQMFLKIGKPDVFFTEFTSTDGLCSAGYTHVSKRLQHTKEEYPLIGQLWGNNPKYYFESAKMLHKLGFAGIDINMGCPVKTVIKNGCCGALITNPKLAAEIIEATKQGAQDLPVSVKTRIGFNSIITEEWISFLLKQDLQALTVHGRTVSELSKVPAHWEEIGKAVKIRDKLQKDTLLIGNGDIETYEQALKLHKRYGVDGVMIGRGVFKNPWIFNSHIDETKISINEKLQLLIDHITLFKKTWNTDKPPEIMKKYYKIYVSSMPNASDFRLELMHLQTPEETIEAIKAKMKYN